MCVHVHVNLEGLYNYKCVRVCVNVTRTTLGTEVEVAGLETHTDSALVGLGGLVGL